MLSDEKLKNLKKLLERHHEWPALYTFKFIVPQDKLGQVKALFPSHPVILRDSKHGNYVSVTVQIELKSADVVIAIYQKASTISGLIAL